MFEKLKQNKVHKELEELKKKVVGAIDENINSAQESIDEISKILIDFKKHKYHISMSM